MRTWMTRTLVGLAGMGLVAAGQAAPATAAPSRSWPVTPAALGSLYGSVDPGGMASVRVWGSAIWCYAQPTADANVAANLDRLLAPSLDPVAAGGGGRAVVTIGHPAPWVFDNHPRALRPTKLWSCGNHASSVSIPSVASLKPNRDGSPSVQAQRWAAYVGAVSDWIVTRYQGRIQVTLETWNEPNLTSGLNPGLRVPGAARTPREAALSLHRYEAIARSVLVQRGSYGSILLGSSAIFTRPNTFSRAYLSAHNRSRQIDAIHVNIYGFSGRSATGAVVDWDRRAAQMRKRLNGYRALRGLPAYVTEANLNLVNTNRNRSNLRGSITNPAEQRRMATATQMNAYFHGFSGVYWLIPWRQQQAAVFVRTEPGNVARDALAVLQGALQGRQFVGCSSRKGLRTCRFVDPASGAVARVLWRNTGRSKVAVGGGEILEVTGAVRPAGGREWVSTTPIVVR
ncbi:MAG TPA: hypothetical protein VF143_00670 [Candidatus Nanopelagicales bacterium]